MDLLYNQSTTIRNWSPLIRSRFTALYKSVIEICRPNWKWCLSISVPSCLLSINCVTCCWLQWINGYRSMWDRRHWWPGSWRKDEATVVRTSGSSDIDCRTVTTAMSGISTKTRASPKSRQAVYPVYICLTTTITSLPRVIWEQGRVAKGSPSGPWAVRHCAVACIHEYACYAGNFAAKAEGFVEQSLRFC